MPATAHPRAFVIGHPIGHSRSPLLHGHWLRSLGLPGSYEAVDVAPDALAAFFAGLRQAGFAGGNITVPHKQAAMAHVACINAAGRAIDAINTVWLEQDAWVGGNTDAHGFLANLAERAPGWAASTRTAVLLGAGGAARAAVHALLQTGVRVHVVNRTLAHAERIAADFGPLVSAHGWPELGGLLPDADLLVNTTALGMAGQPPLQLGLTGLKRTAIVCDIVYVPLQTALLAAAVARGHRVVDGLGMLLHQAAPGFERWFGVRPVVTVQLRALLEADIAGRLPAA